MPAPWKFVLQVVHDDGFTYQLGKLPVGSYQFDVYAYYVHWMEGIHYLEKSVFFNVTIPGDVDGDYCVGSADFSILAGAYGTSVGDPVYVPEADINCDGYIDSADFSILAGNYGNTA